MMLRVPVPNAPFDLAEKVEATILSQMTEVADQVCDGMLVSGATVLLKNRDGLGGPSGPSLRCRRHALCSAQPDLSYSF